MVGSLIGNENENQRMRMNSVFTCLNKKWNRNKSDESHLELRIITRVSILMGRGENENLIPKSDHITPT